MLSSSRRTDCQYTLFVGLLVAAVLAFPPFARADSTYLYTGQPYNPNPPSGCGGTYTSVCSSIGVSGSITLVSPLGDDLNDALVTPQAFSFSGGTNAFLLTQSSPLPLEFFQFSTDANGNITYWGIELANNSGPNSGCLSGASFICLGTYNNPNGQGDYSAYDYNWGTPDEVYGGGTNFVAGTWTLVATPEPSSIFLLCSGLLGVLGVRRAIGKS
jgi:hypothetical protein